MFLVEIPSMEFFDEVNERFVYTKEVSFQIEHSLISISKWEAKWEKPFLSDREKDKKTREELLDYIRCMTLTKNVNPDVYDQIPDYILKEIDEYIDKKMTATWFGDDKKKNKRRSREIVTAEIIYYWMIALNIPFECQKWHLNKLLTLIKVCSIKSAPSKKMKRNDILRSNASLNAARRQALGTTG